MTGSLEPSSYNSVHRFCDAITMESQTTSVDTIPDTIVMSDVDESDGGDDLQAPDDKLPQKRSLTNVLKQRLLSFTPTVNSTKANGGTKKSKLANATSDSDLNESLTRSTTPTGTLSSESSLSVSSTATKAKSVKQKQKKSVQGSTSDHGASKRDTAINFVEIYSKHGIEMPSGRYNGHVYCKFCKKGIVAKASSIQDHVGLNKAKPSLGASHKTKMQDVLNAQKKLGFWVDYAENSKEKIPGMHYYTHVYICIVYLLCGNTIYGYHIYIYIHNIYVCLNHCV